MFLFKHLNQMTKTLGLGILALSLILTTLGGALIINQTKLLKAQATGVILDSATSIPTLQASITGISINGSNYVVNFTTTNFVPASGSNHVHFYYDTEASTVVNKMYSSPAPYNLATSTKPAGATQLCIIVSDPSHSAIPSSGNCFNLPSISSTTTLTLKLNLSGAYDTVNNVMKAKEKITGILPTAQPFNTSPWNYNGSESVTDINTIASTNDAVDWILVEIRDSTGTTVAERKAALLMKDGSVLFPDSPTTLNTGVILSSTTNSYQVVIRPRNHLAIRTNTPISITTNSTTNLDFTTNSNTLGSNQTLLSTTPTNIYGLKSGNANGDAYIDATDRVQTRTSKESSGLYDSSDLNNDGSVDATDRVLVRSVEDSSDGI